MNHRIKFKTYKSNDWICNNMVDPMGEKKDAIDMKSLESADGKTVVADAPKLTKRRLSTKTVTNSYVSGGGY